ncbi:hypothetical protein KGF54_002581 [Candida jiufengensis]|uniref:uncharacterized protein n=1 Tax=Candida jiufengensis TaxID=497108 RepID=UPI002225211C|nr:uncharacterized protein KGF54_002581 [Candida jiufengensis]KAI5953210.1 hypothetical protein KGF54_002581 [Candida jiufengensis]
MVITTFIASILPIKLLNNLQKSSQYLNDLTSLSIGILLGTVFVILLPESIKILIDSGTSPTNLNIGYPILFGFLCLFVIDQFFKDYIESDTIDITSTKNPIVESFKSVISSSITLSLLIHGSIDGISLGSSFVSTNKTLKILLCLGIILHKLPTAFSFGIILKSENKIHERFFILHLVLFALSTPCFALSSFGCLSLLKINDNFNFLIGEILLFSTGNFLFIVLNLINSFFKFRDENVSEYNDLSSGLNSFQIDDSENQKVQGMKFKKLGILGCGLIIPIILSFIQE